MRCSASAPVGAYTAYIHYPSTYRVLVAVYLEVVDAKRGGNVESEILHSVVPSNDDSN